MRTTGWALIAVLIASLGTSCSAPGTDTERAAEPEAAPAAPDVTPAPTTPPAAPRELLAESMAFVAGLEGLSVNVALSSAIKQADNVRSAEAQGEVLLSGDDLAYLRVTNATDVAEVFANAEEQTVHFVNKAEYLVREAPDSRADVVGAMSGGPMRQGSLLLGKFLHQAPELLEQLEAGRYTGQVTPDDGPPCHALELTYPDYDLTLWIREGEAPLPQRMALDLTRAYSKAGAADEVHVTLTFSDWEMNPSFAAETFAFAPPEGAKEMKMDARARARSPQLDLLGEAAPPIEGSLLGGAPFSLADHAEQDVVILEFWATWCGPCRRAMPLVAEVAQAYADRNVVLYAVNIKETPAQVQAYVDQIGYTHPVVLDPRGQAAVAYKASNIPQTVLIGKDGTVQAVHRGFSPYLRKQLSEELDKLVAGEALVEAN